jgi:hypothetical protein
VELSLGSSKPTGLAYDRDGIQSGELCGSAGLLRDW